MKVTKDWNDYYEIEDSEDSIKAAREKGYKPVFEVTKDGKKVFQLDADDQESIKAAFAKGYTGLDTYKMNQDLSSKIANEYTPAPKWLSAMQGAASVGAWGADDEIVGFAKGVKGLLQGDDYLDNYRAGRDQIRAQKKQLEEDNPYSYIGGGLIGGAVGPSVLGAAAKTVVGALGKGAAEGAIQGGVQSINDSENEGFWETTYDGVKGAAKGAVFGTLFGGAANVITRGGAGAVEGFKKDDGFFDKAARTAKGIWTGGDNSLQNEMQAFKRGLNESNTDLGSLGAPLKVLNGIKETIKSSDAAEDFRKQIVKWKANTISRMVEDGGSEEGLRSARSMMDQMSDDDFILRSLSDEGENEVKEWVAKNAAALGGQIDSGDYNKVLSLGTDVRNQAIDFTANKRSYAKELAPDVEQANSSMKSAIKDRVSTLSDEAGSNFTDSDMLDVANSITNALNDSKSMSMIPSSVRKRLNDGVALLAEGRAPSHYGLNEGLYQHMSPVEKFNRLQKLRETLDNGIDWDAIKTGKRTMNEGEQILAQVRSSVDVALKATPGKTQADEVYRLGKEIRDAVFKKTELKGGVDSSKLNRLFGNNDEGIRFRESLEKLRDWAADSQYAPEAREAAEKLLKQFDNLYQIADNAQAINGFRWKQGPSSPAIERMQSVLNKNTLVQDAVLNPSNFVSGADQFFKNFAKDVAGKSFKEMGEAEKSAFIKLWQWHAREVKDGIVTPESMKENYQKYLKLIGKKIEPTGGNNMLTERIKAPSQGMKTTEQVVKMGEEYFQKPFSQMTKEEKRIVTNFTAAIKANPDLTFPEAVRLWGKK